MGRPAVAAAAFGAGVNTTLYTATTKKINTGQIVKEAGKGALTSLLGSAVSALTGPVAGLIPNPFVSQLVSQASTNAICSGIQHGFEKREFSFRQIVVSAVAGSAGAACGTGANTVGC